MSQYQYVLNAFGLGRMAPRGSDYKPVTAPEPGQLVITKLKLKYQDIELDLSNEAVLVDVNRPKIIVATEVTGRDGSVKEYIAEGDAQIAIYGVLAGPALKQYPEEKAELLKRICSVKDSIQVISPYLQLWGITDIVIENRNMPQRAGFAYSQLFEINALSDSPEELVLEDA